MVTLFVVVVDFSIKNTFYKTDYKTKTNELFVHVTAEMHQISMQSPRFFIYNTVLFSYIFSIQVVCL